MKHTKICCKNVIEKRKKILKIENMVAKIRIHIYVLKRMMQC